MLIISDNQSVSQSALSLCQSAQHIPESNYSLAYVLSQVSMSDCTVTTMYDEKLLFPVSVDSSKLEHSCMPQS